MGHPGPFIAVPSQNQSSPPTDSLYPIPKQEFQQLVELNALLNCRF